MEWEDLGAPGKCRSLNNRCPAKPNSGLAYTRGSEWERMVIFLLSVKLTWLGHKSKHLWARNWNYSMAFVICSVAMGQNASEYDALVKRGRLKMGNLIKDEGFTQTTNSSEQIAQPSQLNFENTPVKDWVPPFTPLCNKLMIYYLIKRLLHFKSL